MCNWYTLLIFYLAVSPKYFHYCIYCVPWMLSSTHKTNVPQECTQFPAKVLFKHNLVAWVYWLYCCGIVWVTIQLYRYRSNPNAWVVRIRMTEQYHQKQVQHSTPPAPSLPQDPLSLFYLLYVVKIPVLGVIRKGILLTNVLMHSLVKFMMFWFFIWCLKIKIIDGVPACLGITLSVFRCISKGAPSHHCRPARLYRMDLHCW
jgi:hypothetical protein